ncbi:unnamed protein product, partial [Meganyctiphanes norvegica]
MAMNVLIPLLIPLGEQMTNITMDGAVGNLRFSKPSYEVFVRENHAPVLLLTLYATTNTSGSMVWYSLVGGGLGGLFRVEPATGKLTLTRSLDYEQRNKYEVVVGARCSGEKAYGHVMVRVRDENDRPPVFSRPLFETQITEEDDRHLPKPILQVSAHDGDRVDYGKLEYTVSGVDSSRQTMQLLADRFAINASTGYIHLLRPLDRDPPNGRGRWALRVSAWDGRHRAHATVHVNVKDVNDNAPAFPHHTVNAKVMENQPAGAGVAVVQAEDADDPEEGQNAQLTYSIEKNVIAEASGHPIFAIENKTGRITTALCCLDRERTQNYVIHVVATDGGGLKGTGTVVVTVGDDNDVAPRFTRINWQLQVSEDVKPNSPFATLSLTDPDTSNDFNFRVVPREGHGWERFRVVSSGNGSGLLQAITPLDYEDPDQRQGYRIKVQVSDKVGDWEGNSVASSWVSMRLLDANDHTPRLTPPIINITRPEDFMPGPVLAAFSATDQDEGINGQVVYSIDPESDPDDVFEIDPGGRVRLRRPLDREVSQQHKLHILSVDGGQPPRTATAMLIVTVTDVNDNAPHIVAHEGLHVTENEGPQHVAILTLEDGDDWSLGHGPPFSLHMAQPKNEHSQRAFNVSLQPLNLAGPDGGAVAVVRTLLPLDREKGAVRLLPLVLADAQGRSATQTLSLTLRDRNDNPMAPAAKHVKVIRIKGDSSSVGVGRVHVSDPDDWDVGDKTWGWWLGRSHPLFSLNYDTGQLTMSNHAKDGMYFLQFSVSDLSHGQSNIQANVTVEVSSLKPEVIAQAVPILIINHTPRDLLTHTQGSADTPLEKLMASVSAMVGGSVSVLSLEDRQVELTSTQHRSNIKQPCMTRLWLKAGHPTHALDQLLLLHRTLISQESRVQIYNVGVGGCVTLESSWSWLVDANITSLVTPRLVGQPQGCHCHPRVSTQPTTCDTNPCLNGGRCVLQARGP